MIKQRPKYANLIWKESKISMMLRGTRYYRHGGDWDIKSVWKGGKLVAKADYRQVEHLDGCEFVECTEAEWREDNGRYAPKSKES